MFARSSIRTALDIRWIPIMPLTRAVYIHQTSTIPFHATPAEIPPQSGEQITTDVPSQSELPTLQSSPPQSTSTSPSTTTTIPPNKLPIPPTFTKPLTLTPSLTSLLPHLTTQTPHYITAHLHARPYLLTAGDTLRLPFLMPNVKAGDILRFNRASVIGSRDFTLKGAPYVDERLFECRVRVIGTESEPLRIKEKTKQRQRHVRRVKSKHRYTILRVVDVKVKGLDELVNEGAEIVGEDMEGMAGLKGAEKE
ncbi:aconitate hydratase [Histoplasma capsulatum]|uniref:Large ribosomal subunit protein bL21m n=1 Tax=Ajellomyces capsulatus TaxID=5037 RepID=A0A8A1M8S8_AJECA|nr:aconitate hydratase [Histoplasma capsulatum]